MQMAQLELSSIGKTIGKNQILKSIDLAIEEGEFVVLVGPSGCGKSTLLRIIAGLDNPTSGDVAINGKSAAGLLPNERGVAMVFQSYALYPHLSVYDNIAFALKMAKKPKAEIETAVNKSAQILGISQLLDRRPSQLSGGQKQRVAIGRAIVRSPKLFLLDEPLSNLDAGLRVHMRHEFARLHRELSTTMIYVTHDQVEAMTLADRIVVLNHGKIEQIGTPDEIYSNPNNLFVAGFLGSPRMNFFAAIISKLGAGFVEVTLANGQKMRVNANSSGVKSGDKVTLGVRPDALTTDIKTNSMKLQLDIVENIGSGCSIYGTFEGHDEPVAAVAPATSKLKRFETVELGFKPSDGYLFDAAGNAFGRTLSSLN